LVEPSFEAIAVAERIKGLASGLGSSVSAVLNKIDSERIAVRMEGELRVRDIKVIGSLPNDSFVFEACLDDRSLSRGKAFHAAGRILNNLLSKDRDMN
jgi:CO dehydrogenase nickel-insertion accessory protein CooC1